MRIVIIGPAYPYRGGIADTDESLCRALIELGHDTVISTFTKQYPKIFFPGKTEYVEGVAPVGIDITRSIHSYNPFSWAESARQISSHRPDLIIFRFWTPFIASVYKALAKKLGASAKILAMVDNASPHEGTFVDQWLTKGFLSQVKGVMCLSSYVAAQVKEMVDVPVSSYPHPINSGLGKKSVRGEALTELGLDPTKRYILFFGLVRKYKGLEILLKSLALVKEELPDLQLIIAGEFYDSADKYRRLIESEGLKERVHIHDHFIPAEKVATYFSAAELLTLTYKSATQSGVTQIAMHFDLPMLVTDVGALREYVKQDEMGYVLNPDPASISEALLDFIKNDRYDAMSKSVQENKGRYSWKHFGVELLRLAEKI